VKPAMLGGEKLFILPQPLSEERRKNRGQQAPCEELLNGLDLDDGYVVHTRAISCWLVTVTMALGRP
jgi:hypothetical protein